MFSKLPIILNYFQHYAEQQRSNWQVGSEKILRFAPRGKVNKLLVFSL